MKAILRRLLLNIAWLLCFFDNKPLRMPSISIFPFEAEMPNGEWRYGRLFDWGIAIEDFADRLDTYEGGNQDGD